IRPITDLLNALAVPAHFFSHNETGAGSAWELIRRSDESFYRPPNGRTSLWTHALCRLTGKKIVLWDFDIETAHGENIDEIVEWILFCAQPGSILRFRAGNPRTESTLRELLPRFCSLGYEPVALGDMELHPLSAREAIQRSFQTYERYSNRVN